jgi:hypothetical protein
MAVKNSVLEHFMEFVSVDDLIDRRGLKDSAVSRGKQRLTKQAFALRTPVVSVKGSRVENRRSGFSLPVAVGVLSHDPPQSGWA